MWLFTKLGFYSVVCARLDGGHGRPDPNRLMVRSRRVEWLARLQDEFPDVLGVLPIHESPSADYAARIFVDKIVWAEKVMPKLALMIDYDNFKGELTRSKQHEYHDACSGVWSVMHRLQKRRTAPSYSSMREPLLERASFKSPPLADGLPKSPPLIGDPVPAPRPWDTDPDAQVVVVCRWQDGAGVEPLYIMADTAHYKRSRVAVRDATKRGWGPYVPRVRLALYRMKASDSHRRYPNLKWVSMKGVVPSVGFANGFEPKDSAGSPLPE